MSFSLDESTVTKNALETLEKRYFLRDDDGNVAETAEELWSRIATAVASVEPHDQQEWTEKFEALLAKLDFLPNTPTIINAGREGGQLSACFVLPINDSMDSIFTTLKDAAIIHKTGGGTGFDFSRLRPEGATVSNKTGVSTGPISFAKVYNAATDAVKQGATRRGANMMNLRVDHPDILKFIDMKNTPGVMTNFNVSVTVTNEFMEALEADEDYELKHPVTGVVDTLSARYVWDLIARNAWQSAEPGILFIDRINEKSPYWETIEASNPCGEQPLPPYGSCNLGSINLSNFVVDRQIDWKRLEEVIRTSVRFLDNVIDANSYPTQELHDHAQKYRNIGLGVMGWADMLIKLKIPYTSEEAVSLARGLMEFVNKVAHQYSVELAAEKGSPSAAPFKTFFDYSSPERRNATLTTVAPTGSISILADCSSGIEPNFAFRMEKHIMDSVMVVYHTLYEKASNNGGVDASIFIDAHQVDVDTHVDMQAAFQANCDSAISKTINLPNSATVRDVQEAYFKAWRTGCKGITVYRDGSREGVLHRRDEPKTTEEGYCTDCGGELVMESGCEKCLSCGLSKCLIS